MAYSPTTWNVNDPITQNKMNKIEKGIEDAHSGVETNATSITANRNNITSLTTRVTNVEGVANEASSTAGTALQATSAGNNAWTNVSGALEYDNNTGEPKYTNLKTRFQQDEASLAEAQSNLQLLQTEVTTARGILNYYGNNAQAPNLASKISDITTKIDAISGSITTNQDDYRNARGGYNTLQDRLNAIDGDTTNLKIYESKSLASHVTDLEAEVENARKSAINNTDYASVDARLEADETTISNLQTGKLNADSTGIVDNLTQSDVYKALSANQGRVLKNIIGSGYNESNTVATGINNAQTNAQNYADTNKVDKTDIYNGVDHTADDQKVLDARVGKTLQDAIDNINTGLNTENTGIIARISALETEVDNANGNGTLDDRFDSIEDNINTIATELNMLDNAGAMKNTQTRVDDLDTHVTELATELGMISNGEIVNTNTRVDQLESRMEAVDDTTTGSIAALASRVTTAEGDIDTLEGDLNTASTGLKARMTAAESDINTLESDLNTASTGIKARLTTLENEPKSATTIIEAECITYNSETGVPTIYTDNTKTTAITPTQDTDYLLENENGKYYYWKYIGTSPNGTWNLISGGSGSGSSSGEFAASLSSTDIPEPNVNTDYFVGNNTAGYIHYRYVEDNGTGTFIKILPKGLLTNASVNANGKPIITTLEDTSTNVLNSFNALKTVNCTTTYDTDGVTPKSYALSFTDVNGQEYTWDLAAGGGGSSYTVQFLNESGNLELYVPNDANSAIISAKIYARLGQELLSQTGSITVKYKAESAAEYTTARVISGVVNNTTTNIDVIDLLEQNAITNIQLTASIQPEDTPITRNITYTIHRVPMSIEAYNYNPASVKTSNFNFQYYCIGSNLAKIVHFVIDGVETTEDIGIPANTDLLTKQIVVGELARGMHSLKVYFTVGSYSSNEINTYFLYDDGTQENKPIIALSTNKSTIQDGENLNLNYTVYTKGFEKTELITLETYTIIDNVRTTYETKSYENVDNSIQHPIAITNYPSSGTFYMTMTAIHTVNNVAYTENKTISIIITEYESAYDSQMVRAGIANMIYEYDAAGRTNNDSDKEAYQYTYTSVSGSSKIFTGANTGFNWASNGYTNGSSLVISGGAVHTIDVPLFLSSTNEISLETDTDNDDILKNGRTFEIDYEVNSATDLNAQIASFGDGLKITPSVSYLVPQGTTVTVNSHGLIEKEDEICAAYLATGKRMHMVFVIEPKSTTPTSQGEYHQCVNIYINGEFVNSCPYALSDNFSTNSTFTIGSNTCIIKLYSVHMYNRGLTNDDVLRNYMMAPATKIDKINRFAANDVLDNNKLVDYNKARNKFNCLLITGEISPYKKTTKTPSGVTLTKPDTVNSSYTTEFNLLDKKGNGTYYSSNNVQGTSSQTYPIHNLKVYLAKEAIDEVTGDPISKKYKYSLKGANGIAESTLCWKADYMSTDHANTFNANFANDLFTDKLPSQLAEPKVQNTVYGIRCLLFQRDDENSTPVFIADGCLNNDKGNNSAFGLVDKTYDEAEISEGVTRPLNDTTRQKWEFTNNSSALDFFKADGLLADNNGDFYAKTAFESTYPDEGDLEDEELQPNYNHLQVLMTWVHQRANYWDASDTVTGTTYNYNGQTYNNLKAYKKAIFINEFQRHFNLNHTLTYHLFSEFIALCDNRAKNMFVRCDNVREEIVKDTSNNVIFSGNSNPNASFFESTTNIGTNEDPIYAFANSNNIDWEGSTFAVWYPVLYDLDSCYGAENVGRITIPYDADWNYVYNNKNQFSGVDSRLWLMVEDSFAAELKTLAQTLYPNSLNYNTFYTTQIQAMLDSVCPAMINQDMLLKFNAYWADGFIDYSLPNNPHVYRDYKYIQRGSRAYQKDTFIKLRSNYLSSKYTTSNFMNDQIRFRSSVVVPVSNSGITLTTNQTLYPAITYGDNKEAIRSTTKVGPGGSVTLYASDQVGNTDTIHIGGASALTDIGDISKFEPYNLDVSGGVNLKNLVVGSNTINASTNKIDGLGSCALLETLNVRNCTNFSGTLNLSGNGLIRNVYAAGSGISNIELREGGNLTNIEYGAQTSTIKIINHGSLQNFTYENSENNHYANVTRLHIENTPNVPIVDIINNAMAHLTAGIRITGMDIDLFANTSTEQEIEDALQQTTRFLNTLVSDIAYHKYINSAGVFVANSTEPPHIAGKVHITSIRQSLLNKLSEMYPNLIIYNAIDSNGVVSNNIVTEYTITYQNYDGTVLYTDYRTGDEHYIDPASTDPLDIDPITNDRRISIPTKPDDVQYKYTFGTYTNGEDYDRYSGWVHYGTTTSPVDDDYVSGNTILVAYYPTTTIQQYTVTWYEEPAGAPILSYTANYGIDLSTYQQPEERGAVNRTKVVNGVKKVFKGWNRPVGKLTGNINVYAQWETSTIDNAITYSDIDMSAVNAADLYAISSLGAEAKRRILEDRLGNDPIFIRMGQDFNYTEGVNTTDLLNGADSFLFTSSTAEAKIYDGAHALGEIRPLAINGDWTLALDYKFLLNSTIYAKSAEFVLASCYKNANSTIQGFKLSLVKNSDTTSPNQSVRISWGTSTTTIDYVTIDTAATDAKQYSKSYRNVVVLRHSSANPTNLYVYYLAPDITNTYADYGADYGTTVVGTTLTWANVNNLNTPLILGGNYSEDTTNIENSRSTRCPARGIIYWAKYWDVDLGAKNCMALASWPHETVPFYLSGYNNNTSPNRQIVENTELSFIAAQGLGDRYLYARVGELSASTTEASWRYSRARTLCNGIIYNAMPIAYQSILHNTAIESVAIDININGDNVSLVTSNDYLYLPAEREVSGITPSNAYKIDEIWSNWNSPWPWMQSINITNWYVESNVSGTLELGNANNIAPFLYRFSGAYIAPTARIYRISNDPYNNGGTWTYNNNQISVQSGDVWVNDNNIAYMYFTSNEINNKGIYVDIINNGGGWKKADLWNIRTYNINANYSSELLFERVEDDGTLNTSPTTTANDRYKPRLLCPEFSI